MMLHDDTKNTSGLTYDARKRDLAGIELTLKVNIEFPNEREFTVTGLIMDEIQNEKYTITDRVHQGNNEELAVLKKAVDFTFSLKSEIAELYQMVRRFENKKLSNDSLVASMGACNLLDSISEDIKMEIKKGCLYAG